MSVLKLKLNILFVKDKGNAWRKIQTQDAPFRFFFRNLKKKCIPLSVNDVNDFFFKQAIKSIKEERRTSHSKTLKNQ